jgi:hypothetical protein
VAGAVRERREARIGYGVAVHAVGREPHGMDGSLTVGGIRVQVGAADPVRTAGDGAHLLPGPAVWQ